VKTTSPTRSTRFTLTSNRQALEGLTLLFGIIALMWVVELLNVIDSGGLDMGGGIYPRNFDHLWAIFTAPFLHENFYPHLVDNTIPLVFMGAIIALRGAGKLALVTLIVIVIGGLGTWLIAPANTDTFGASGLVFGYATYLFARGLFDRSLLEILTGAVVGVVWGGVLVSSVVPHPGVSWQGHVCGALGGVVAAWLLAGRASQTRSGNPAGKDQGTRSSTPGEHRELHEALDRAIAQ
jgi:membrane associated rhomboid family serine protease